MMHTDRNLFRHSDCDTNRPESYSDRLIVMLSGRILIVMPIGRNSDWPIVMVRGEILIPTGSS